MTSTDSTTPDLSSIATPRQLWALNRAGKLGLLKENPYLNSHPGEITKSQADEAIKASIAEAKSS